MAFIAAAYETTKQKKCD